MADETGGFPTLPVAELPEQRPEASKSTISASRRVRARLARRMTAQRSAMLRRNSPARCGGWPRAIGG